MKTYAELLASIDIGSIEKYTYNRFDLDGKMDKQLLVYSSFELGVITREEAINIYEDLGFNEVRTQQPTSQEVSRVISYNLTTKGFHIPLAIRDEQVIYVSSKLHLGVDKEILEQDSLFVELPLQIFHEVLANYQEINELTYMKQVPEKLLLGSILQQAKAKQAGDITMQLKNDKVIIYYNDVVGGIMELPLRIDYSQFMRIFDILMQNYTIGSIKDVCTVDVAYDMWVDTEEGAYLFARLRVNASAQVSGISITMRLLPTEDEIKLLENLNLSKEAYDYLYKNLVLNKDNGLNIVAGATSSGKNTTVMGVLLKINEISTIVNKVIVVEMPSETLLPDNFFQASANNIDEYNRYIDACLRQAGDFYYFTEISDKTGENILRVANLGKPVYTSLHANNVEGVIMRMADITGMNYSEIIERLSTVIVQRLQRDENRKVKPIIEALRFTNEMKDKLRGKSKEEIITIIREEKSPWM